MTSGFDPYYHWLGIPPAEQPANWYRLLGLANFEADPVVINNASNQRLQFLRSHANGPYNQLALRVIQEVERARNGLLDSGTRTAYEAGLRPVLAAREAAKQQREGVTGVAPGNQPGYRAPIQPSPGPIVGPSQTPRSTPPSLPVNVVPSASQVVVSGSAPRKKKRSATYIIILVGIIILFAASHAALGFLGYLIVNKKKKNANPDLASQGPVVTPPKKEEPKQPNNGTTRPPQNQTPISPIQPVRTQIPSSLDVGVRIFPRNWIAMNDTSQAMSLAKPLTLQFWFSLERLNTATILASYQIHEENVELGSWTDPTFGAKPSASWSLVIRRKAATGFEFAIVTESASKTDLWSCDAPQFSLRATHHLCLVADGSRIVLCLNGEPLGAFPNSRIQIAGKGKSRFCIGNTPSLMTTEAYSGVIRGVRLHLSPLVDEAFAPEALWESANPAMDWKLKPNSEQTVPDRTGNGRDANIFQTINSR